MAELRDEVLTLLGERGAMLWRHLLAQTKADSLDLYRLMEELKRDGLVQADEARTDEERSNPTFRLTPPKPTTPEPPQYHWWPGEPMGNIDSGFYVAVMGKPTLGYVYETTGGGWVATHPENYGKLSVPGFASREAAFDFLFYFAAPAAREV